MTSSVQEATRPVWVLTPLDKAGPLRFGMCADEVGAVLPGALELSRFKADPFYPEILPSSPGRGVSYGPRGNPGINGLGLVLRVQETEMGVLTRPVLVGRDWADRCTDDAEGCIPKCEWVGRQWPYPGYPAVWPSAGDEPNWPHGRYPPF